MKGGGNQPKVLNIVPVFIKLSQVGMYGEMPEHHNKLYPINYVKHLKPPCWDFASRGLKYILKLSSKLY